MKLSAAIVMPAAEVTRIGSDENDTTVSIESLILRRNDHLETAESRGSRSYWISVWLNPAGRIRPDVKRLRSGKPLITSITLRSSRQKVPVPRRGWAGSTTRRITAENIAERKRSSPLPSRLERTP